jgi:hypothetical protein
MQTNNFGDYDRQSPKEASRAFLYQMVLVVVLVLIYVVINKHFVVDKTLTIDPSPGYTVSLGTPSNGKNISISHIIVKTSTIKKIHLKKGYYVALFTENSNYAPIYKKIYFAYNSTLSSPPLNYSENKLMALMSQYSPAIQSAFQNSSSGGLLSQSYSIQNIGLYNNGDWYVGRLEPTDPSQENILVFVMDLQAGQWRLVAGPAIILYLGDYPDVPSNVVEAADSSPPGINLPY